jgi:hypothetical protein
VNFEEAKTPESTEYREWLVPSIGNFIAAAIIMPSCYLVFLPINPPAGFWLGIVLMCAIWTAMLAASARIEVSEGQLRVGKAHIPIRHLSQGREIPSEFRFAERGPSLDARAYVRFQVGVRSLVRFENIDPEDPTPYWLVSTRHSESLLAAVNATS